MTQPMTEREEKARASMVWGGHHGQGRCHRIAIIVPNIAKEPGFLNRTGSRATRTRKPLPSSACPSRKGERSWNLGVDVRSGPEEKPGQDLELLMIIASMIAQRVSIHRARQEETHELRESNQRLRRNCGALPSSNIIGTQNPCNRYSG